MSPTNDEYVPGSMAAYSRDAFYLRSLHKVVPKPKHIRHAWGLQLVRPAAVARSFNWWISIKPSRTRRLLRISSVCGKPNELPTSSSGLVLFCRICVCAAQQSALRMKSTSLWISGYPLCKADIRKIHLFPCTPQSCSRRMTAAYSPSSVVLAYLVAVQLSHVGRSPPVTVSSSSSGALFSMTWKCSGDSRVSMRRKEMPLVRGPFLLLLGHQMMSSAETTGTYPTHEHSSNSSSS